MQVEGVKTGDYWKDQMLSGNFEKAWQFSDRVLWQRAGKPCWHLPRHQQYVWNGTSLKNKKVLVRCYHGLGDTIQFIRYAPLLKQIASQVIVWAQAPLIKLLETVDGIDKLIPLHDGEPDVAYDVDVEVMELPHIFRTTIETIPNRIPYIHTKPMNLKIEGVKVGVVWKVGDWDESRTISFEHLLPLFSIPGVSIVILQSDPHRAGWQEHLGSYPGPLGLYDYARLIKSLDLVLTVDSMPAHLAGAQDVKVWTLLKYRCDWRWMNDRGDSPWYPTMRLYRQDSDENWDKVIARVRKDIMA